MEIARNNLEASAISINKVNSKVESLDELDFMLVDAVSDKITVMQALKENINISLTDPVLVSDPQALAKVQAMMAEYNVTITLFEKMASSGVKAVDTLVKS